MGKRQSLGVSGMVVWGHLQDSPSRSAQQSQLCKSALALRQDESARKSCRLAVSSGEIGLNPRRLCLADAAEGTPATAR